MPADVLIFKTSRLLVRRFCLADLPAYQSVEGNPRVMRFITGRPRTTIESRKRLIGCIRAYGRCPGIGVWAVIEKSTKLYLGTASLYHLENCNELQIGYKLRPLAQGKGYATEIARALVQHAFEKLDLSKVVAVTHPQNEASQRVLRKAGLSQSGYHAAYGQILPFFILEKEHYFERLRNLR